jgi:cytochrome c-type biogenesis protein CcmH/NrfF
MNFPRDMRALFLWTVVPVVVLVLAGFVLFWCFYR